MTALTLPLCYFPSTVLAVGLEDDMLLAELAQLGPFPVHNEQRIENITELVLRPQSANHFASHWQTIERLLHLPEVDQELAQIAQEIHHGYRYQEISTLLLTDANIPKLVEHVLEPLAYHCVRKCLLISPDNLATAEQLHKERLIDSYVVNNNDPNLPKELATLITELQRHYFLYLSRKLSYQLTFDMPTCLSHPSYTALLNELLTQTDYCEFYLLNQNGNALLVDPTGKAACLVFKTQAHVDADLRHPYSYQLEDRELEQVLQGKMLPILDGDQFELVPAQAFSRGDAFYALLQDSPSLKDVQAQITPFVRYTP